MGKVVLILVCATFAAVSAQNVVPCMRTRAECRSGVSGVMVFNNNYFCCAAGYTMQALNDNCSCIQTSEVKSCDTGRQACQNAASMTSRNGNVRCCQQGYSMQSSNFMVNGRFINSCTCTRWLGNQVSGSVVMGDFNSTAFNQQMAAFGQRMNDWGTRFSASMNDWGQRLNNRMQSMGSRLRRMFSFY